MMGKLFDATLNSTKIVMTNPDTFSKYDNRNRKSQNNRIIYTRRNGLKKVDCYRKNTLYSQINH